MLKGRAIYYSYVIRLIVAWGQHIFVNCGDLIPLFSFSSENNLINIFLAR